MPLTPTAPEAHWTQSIAAVIGDLESMNRESEAGFLAVGGELARFQSISTRISSNSGAIAELISGEQGQRQCDALKRLLDGVQRQEERTQSARLIPSLRRLAGALRSCFAGFDGTAFAFKQVATLGRIEIGRLDVVATGLNQLTGEMRSSSEDIRARVTHFLDTAGLLDSRLNALLTGLADFGDKEAKALPPLVKIVDRSLEEFRERQQRSERAARELGKQFDDLSRAIGDVVLSMQSHDITRQRIEHIVAALARFSAAEAGESAGASPTPEEAAVLDLQLAQLESAARTFESSIGAIDRGLATIAGRVVDMAAESAALVDRSSNENDTFEGIERSMLAVVEATRHCAALERDAQAALSELGETIGRLVKALAEIVAVGSNLRLLALNTVVQARQLGPAGEPLRAVAAAVRELQLICEERSREGSEILAQIGAAISSMAGAGDMSPVVDALSAKMDELQASAQRSADACQEILSLAGGLRADVERTRASFAVARGFEETANRCCETLRLIVGEFKADEAHPDAALWLAQHADRYTMDAQREVHERVLGQTNLEGAESLCGEVELF